MVVIVSNKVYLFFLEQLHIALAFDCFCTRKSRLLAKLFLRGQILPLVLAPHEIVLQEV
jgi:hypothetical protein